MTPQEAVSKIKNSICHPIKGDRWSLRLWRKWRKQKSINSKLKGIRVPDYEHIIAKDFMCTYWYAITIVQKKLPNQLHNVIVSQGIIDPNNRYVKVYFDMIEGKF